MLSLLLARAGYQNEEMSTNLQDYVELLNAEQHVQVDKLRDFARHGIAPRVRGEVWMYLLNVLSEDKTSEITTVMAFSASYGLLPSSLPSSLSALLLKTALRHHTHRFYNPTYAGLISSITAEPVAETQGPDRGRDVARRQLPSTSNSSGNKSASTGRSITPTSTENRSNIGTSGSRTSGVLSSTSSSGSVPTSSNPSGGGILSSSPPSNTSSAPTSTFSSKSDPPSIQPTLSRSVTTKNSGQAADETQTLRTQYGKFLPPPPITPPSRHSYLTLLDEVLGKFYHSEREDGRDGEYRRRRFQREGSEEEWVWLITPFMCCLTRPVAVYLGFQKLMERMRSFPPLSARLAMVLTVFRMAIPDLFLYFEDEQVPYQLIALSWVRTLFAKEMWLGNVMRLWDAYLAADDMFELHCYVCVAVLATCRETLEELDGGEVKMMLLDLPPLDIDRLLQDAANLRVTYTLPRPVSEE